MLALSQYERDLGPYGVSVDSVLDRVVASVLGAELADDCNSGHGPELLAAALQLADRVIGEGHEIVVTFIDGSAIRICADLSWEC